MSNQKRTEDPRKFVFGNEKFGGSYTPGEFEINFPEDMSREEFEKMFTRRINAFHRKGTDFAEEFFDKKSKKENLKPLSIRVKPHTKEFFKNHSILSARDVLEIYENFNNGSEAFINSLLEEEKNLEKELKDVQEKLHSAKLFKEKLSEMEPDKTILTDDDKILKLNQLYEFSEIKSIGNETSVGKAKNDIIRDIQIYNTLIIRVYENQVLSIGVYTNAEPIVYYFKNEYSADDINEILKHVEEYCKDNEISYNQFDNSVFDD